MSRCRSLSSALAIFISMLIAEPFLNSDSAFGQSLEEAARLNQEAIQLYNQGRYADAEPLLKRSLAIQEQALGPNHPEVASLLNNLAEVYESQGRYADAEPLLKRSLAIRENARHPNPADVAESLGNLAGVYSDQGRYAEAESLYKRALAITEKTSGPNHPDVARVLNNLAELYRIQGRYAEAEPLDKRSLMIREKTLDPDDPDVAESLNNLALVYIGQGRYVDAEPLFKRSLAVWEKALGPDHPDIATALNNLANLYEQQDRYADAEPLYKHSLAIRERALGPDHPDVAISLNNLAGLYSEQGRYADAEPLYKRSLAIREKALGPTHPDVAGSLNSLAELYQKQGRYGEAEPLYKRSLQINEKVLGPDHLSVAQALNNLALLYNDQSHYEDVEPLLRRSLEIYEQRLGPDHLAVAKALNDLALLYYNQGRYAEAEPLSKRSLAIREKTLGPDHTVVAQSLNNLASLYEVQGRYIDAEPLYNRALAIREKALGGDHPDVALTLNNLAALYETQSRYADAEPLYKHSLAIQEKTLGPDHPDVATSLNNLADLYEEQGRYAEGEPLFQRSLAIWEKALGPDGPNVATSLNNLAKLYDAQSRYGDAMTIVRQMMKRGFFSSDPSFSVLMGSQKAGHISEAESFSDSYEVLQLVSSSAAAEAVKKLAQRFAAGSSEMAALVRKDQDLAVEADGLDKALVSAVSKAPDERSSLAEQQLRSRLSGIETERKKLTGTLKERFPDFVALANPQPLTLQETQELLAEDEAVVAFNIGEKKSYAWVVTKTATDWAEIPINAKTLNEEITKLRQSLTFETDEPFDAVLSHTVYQETFGPIAEKIAGKTRLSIFANGALTSIPFSILITSDPQGKKLKDYDWLLRSYGLTVLPSIYSLKTMRTSVAMGQASKPMIAFADPVFSQKARNQTPPARITLRSMPEFYQGTQIDVRRLGDALPQLPGTRSEVKAVARSVHADSGDLKLGPDATTIAVKDTPLDQYRVVYFATHSLVAGDLEKFAKAKAEPALVLSIPEKPTELDDGLLRASDIAQLKLNADWVVLSACNTASSDGVGAEALSGLAQAFIYAGARSLVVSHWDVNDDASAKIMSALFAISSSQPDLSHGQALQAAEIQLLNAAETDAEAHPRYWRRSLLLGSPPKQTDVTPPPFRFSSCFQTLAMQTLSSLEVRRSFTWIGRSASLDL